MPMKGDSDFYQQLNDQFRLTTILVIYRLPDYQSLLQEFLWQTLDCPPSYPRMHRFLDYWIEHIKAPIHSVQIENVEVISPSNFASVAKYYELKH